MHHLVVRQRQDEVFVEGVNHSEGNLAVVVLAEHGVQLPEAGLDFADRGTRSLKGVPGTWPLFAVV